VVNWSQSYGTSPATWAQTYGKCDSLGLNANQAAWYSNYIPEGRRAKLTLVGGLYNFQFLLNWPDFITCDSSYRLARLSHRSSVRLPVRPFIRLSVTQMDQSKTVQARITKSLPSVAWKTLVLGSVKLFHEFERGHPQWGR